MKALLAFVFVTSPAFATIPIIDQGTGTYCSPIHEPMGRSLEALVLWPKQDSTKAFFITFPEAYAGSVRQVRFGECVCVDFAYQTQMRLMTCEGPVTHEEMTALGVPYACAPRQKIGVRYWSGGNVENKPFPVPEACRRYKASQR